MSEWMSSDDQRNVLLKGMESRMAVCEVLTEKLLKEAKVQNKMVQHISDTIEDNSKQIGTLAQQIKELTEQMLNISKVIVQIATKQVQKNVVEK